jgi:hypothetical protein
MVKVASSLQKGLSNHHSGTDKERSQSDPQLAETIGIGMSSCLKGI